MKELNEINEMRVCLYNRLKKQLILYSKQSLSDNEKLEIKKLLERLKSIDVNKVIDISNLSEAKEELKVMDEIIDIINTMINTNENKNSLLKRALNILKRIENEY